MQNESDREKGIAAANLERSKSDYDFNIEHAKRAHDLNRQMSADFIKAAVDSANLAIRSLTLINGGAVVALLAFIGALESGDAGDSVRLEELVDPIWWFAVGVGCAACAAMCAYLVNMSDADLSNSVRLTWDHPYVVPHKGDCVRTAVRQFFFYFGILLAVGSLGSFFFGIAAVTAAISALSI